MAERCHRQRNRRPGEDQGSTGALLLGEAPSRVLVVCHPGADAWSARAHHRTQSATTHRRARLSSPVRSCASKGPRLSTGRRSPRRLRAGPERPAPKVAVGVLGIGRHRKRATVRAGQTRTRAFGESSRPAAFRRADGHRVSAPARRSRASEHPNDDRPRRRRARRFVPDQHRDV